MGGTLEVFKFGVYIFFPVFMMYHYGNPYWYIDNVIPFRDQLFPPESKLNVRLFCAFLRLSWCLG